MMYQERLLKILRFPHISEKSSVLLEKLNTVVFVIYMYATKKDVADAIYMLFSEKVKYVNIVRIKGKRKGSSGNFGYRSDYKKAYIVLRKGHKIDLFDKM